MDKDRVKRQSFVILTPQYFKDYRQEFYVLNWQKEQLLIKIMLVGAIIMVYGLW